MTLREFQIQLEALIGRPTAMRPFVCDGSPLDCRVFLVGYNPATAMETDFWEFWRPESGFDKAAWFENYKAERASKPLKPGRTRRHAVSPTRRNIEAFVHGAGAVNVLETNIFATPSTDKRSLASEAQDLLPFKFLLETINPRVIVTHGKDANEAIEALVDESVPMLAYQHFSRGVSHSAATELGRSAAALCQG